MAPAITAGSSVGRGDKLFPWQVNKAPYEMLLRVPGIGVKSAQRIRAARRYAKLGFADLKKLGACPKRAGSCR